MKRTQVAFSLRRASKEPEYSSALDGKASFKASFACVRVYECT
jgi:hypothetical protein